MIVLGVLMIVSAVPELTQGEYTHDIETVSESEYMSAVEDGGDDEHTYEFQNLSSEGQDAFLAAVESDEGNSIATTTKRAPDFRYGDSTERYYIMYDSKYYQLTAAGANQLGHLPDLIMAGIALFGVITVTVAGFDLWRHE